MIQCVNLRYATTLGVGLGCAVLELCVEQSNGKGTRQMTKLEADILQQLLPEVGD